jgi:hypothetical protein
MPSRLLYAIIIVVVFSFFASRKSRRQRAATWSGVVREIRHQRAGVLHDEERRDDDWVTVLYQTDEGRDCRLKIRMRVMRQFLNGLQVGDRLTKREGDFLPRRDLPVSESQDTAQPL